MKKILKINMIAFLLLTVLESGISQITKSKFEIVYDESTCMYDMNLHVLEGSATTTFNRIPGINSLTLILPVESQAVLEESIIPNATSWGVSNVGAAPGGDLDKTFVLFNQGIGNLNLYPVMNAGDIILLFRFSLSYDVQGVKGVRPYNGQVDNPGGGGAYGTSLNIGGVNSHNGFLETTFGADYAQAIGSSFIYVDNQTTLSPSTGIWTQTNPGVTSFNNATQQVTGLSEGRSMFTFDPNDGSCPTSVVISVVPEELTAERLGIVEATTDPSVTFGIYGTNAGALIPRMTEEQRLCIAGPANGLILYQIDGESGMYYFNGSTWKRLNNTDAGGSSIQGFSAPNSELLALQEKQEQLLKKIEAQEQTLLQLAKKMAEENN